MSYALDNAMDRLERACSSFSLDTAVLASPIIAAVGSSTSGASGRQSASPLQPTEIGDGPTVPPAPLQPTGTLYVPIELKTTAGFAHVAAKASSGWIRTKEAMRSFLHTMVGR